MLSIEKDLRGTFVQASRNLQAGSEQWRIIKHSASHQASGHAAEDEVEVLDVGSRALASCQQSLLCLPGYQHSVPQKHEGLAMFINTCPMQCSYVYPYSSQR